MRRSRKIKRQATPTYAFVVDGETEMWYLQMLKRNERKLSLEIRPQIPIKKSIEEQYKLVVDLSYDYSKVFWIIDLDVIIKETRETQKGKKTPLHIFKECRRQIEKYQNVIVILNNPCLEFWFLLHFEKTSKLFDTCNKAKTKLKNYLKDYEKTKRYFTKQDNDIYIKLRPFLETATHNSERMGKFDMNEPTKAICQMHLLFLTDELKKYYKF